MKKRLFILALPLIMALSSCGSLQANIQDNGDNGFDNGFDLVKEDTLAHEDIFKDDVRALQPKKLGDPEETPEAGSGFAIAPKVGVQFFPYTKNATDYLAVRYVAAIGGLDGGVTASWTRAVSSDGGTQLKEMAGGHNSTVEYTSLNSGGSPKAATSEGEGYNKYIVYTMYDIPADQSGSYIAAYLKLSKAGQNDVYSRVVAARIDGNNVFSFDHDKRGFFLAGRLDEENNRIADADDDTKEEYDGQNAASFTTYLANNDKFIIVQNDSSLFKTWSGSCLGNENDKVSNVGDLIKISSSRRYVIYLNGSNQIYHAAYGNTATDVYLRGPAADSADGGWGAADESARFYDDPDNNGGFLRYTFGEDDVNKSFKITNKDNWSWSVGYGDTLHGDAKDGTHLTSDGDNIKVLIAGTYNFYVNDGQAWVYFVRGLPQA